MTRLDIWQQDMAAMSERLDARAIAARCCDNPFDPRYTMRHIHDHKLNGLNEAIEITAIDLPGPGGANHRYELEVKASLPPADQPPLAEGTVISTLIAFQEGPIAEVGVNGLSNESLIAVVIDRLRGFQHKRFLTINEAIQAEVPLGAGVPGEFDFNSRGKYACRENAIALTHLEDALMWLQKRTRDRAARGVEGTNAV